MNVEPVPWPTLLSRRFDSVTDQFGPHSQAVAAAVTVMSELEWFAQLGQPLARSDVQVAESLRSAVELLSDNRYNAAGILEAPCIGIDDAIASDPNCKAWWQLARADASENVWPVDVSDTSPELTEYVSEYVEEYISMLLAEIVVGASTTYFREQLSWFHAGRLPCGWAGDWPRGRLRVL